MPTQAVLYADPTQAAKVSSNGLVVSHIVAESYLLTFPMKSWVKFPNPQNISIASQQDSIPLNNWRGRGKNQKINK